MVKPKFHGNSFLLACYEETAPVEFSLCCYLWWPSNTTREVTGAMAIVLTEMCMFNYVCVYVLQEHAFESSQKYKEGKYIIEVAHMIKDNGWD